jgi:hypothetical protein
MPAPEVATADEAALVVDEAPIEEDEDAEPAEPQAPTLVAAPPDSPER